VTRSERLVIYFFAGLLGVCIGWVIFTLIEVGL
jgi:hypothetical protein